MKISKKLHILFFCLAHSIFAVSYTPERAPIYPFINGDTFRAYCDFAYDEITTFDPLEVHPGATVFINGDFLGQFFTQIHPKIVSAYILVCHNTDCSIPGIYRSFLDDPKLLAFFSQNQDSTIHPKLHPLPIGVENRHWNPQNIEILNAVKNKNFPKTRLAYCNFNPNTFPSERNLVRDLFTKASFCTCKSRTQFDVYAIDVATSKFVISPRGNGLDTHRLWEALYAGSFPVVKTSSLDALYADLPVVIVQNWEDVTERFLSAIYEEWKDKEFNLEKLYAAFWINWINSYKENL